MSSFVPTVGMFFWGSYTTARLKPGSSTKVFCITSCISSCTSKFPSKLPNDVSIRVSLKLLGSLLVKFLIGIWYFPRWTRLKCWPLIQAAVCLYYSSSWEGIIHPEIALPTASWSNLMLAIWSWMAWLKVIKFTRFEKKTLLPIHKLAS